MQELKSFLIKQNYLAQIIEHGSQKAMSLDKNVFRTIITKGKDNTVPYLTTYNPRDHEMFNDVQGKYLQNANSTGRRKMRKILSNYKLKSKVNHII